MSVNGWSISSMIIFIATHVEFGSIESILDNLPSLMESRIHLNYPYSHLY